MTYIIILVSVCFLGCVVVLLGMLTEAFRRISALESDLVVLQEELRNQKPPVNVFLTPSVHNLYPRPVQTDTSKLN